MTPTASKKPELMNVKRCAGSPRRSGESVGPSITTVRTIIAMLHWPSADDISTSARAAYLTRANADALLSFSISRYRDKG